MKNLITGIVAGLVIGALIVYSVMSLGTHNGPDVCGTSINAVNINKTLENVIGRLNDMLHESYPNLNVKIIGAEPYGQVYLLTLEIYDKNGTIDRWEMFMMENGSTLLMNNPRCVIKLGGEEQKKEKVEVSEDDDPHVGSDNPKVIIVEISDYTCPYCAKFAVEVEPQIIKNYGDEVKLVFRDFPVHGEISYKAAEAADCAGEQGKYWDYHNTLFSNQREWMSNTSMLYTYAKQLGLNVSAFKACLDSGKYRQEVEKDLQDGKKYGVKGTPTFFINGKMVVGYMSYEEFAKLIDRELERSG